MKYIFIVLGIIDLALFIGYQYLDCKVTSNQEEAYRRHATLEFEESPRSFPDSIRMADAQFWGLIEDSKSKNPGDYDAQMELPISVVNALFI